jgi:hypothetical protein
MITRETEELVADARRLLRQEEELSLTCYISEGTSRPPRDELPGEYVEFLRVANGAGFGRITILSGDHAMDSQFYADNVEGRAIQLGRDAWFCFGKVDDDPLFINRESGSVWAFPDRRRLWWQSDIFKQISNNLDSFINEYSLGNKYLILTGGSEDDPWWEFLGRMGLAAR